MELRRCQEHGFSAKRRGGLQEPMSLAMQSDTLVCGDCVALWEHGCSEPCIPTLNGASEEAGYRSRWVERSRQPTCLRDLPWAAQQWTNYTNHECSDRRGACADERSGAGAAVAAVAAALASQSFTYIFIYLYYFLFYFYYFILFIIYFIIIINYFIINLIILFSRFSYWNDKVNIYFIHSQI